MQKGSVEGKAERSAVRAFVLLGAISLILIGVLGFVIQSTGRSSKRVSSGPVVESPRMQSEQVVAPVATSVPLWTPGAAQLEGRVADLERSVEREKAEKRAAQAEADTAPTPEEERAMFQERLTASKREPVDSRWAATVNDLIRTDLEHALAGGSAKLVEVECRTSTCSATLEWSSQHEAETKYESLFQRPLRANCGVSILLPEQTGDRPGPVRTTALFDCSGWRESGSVPLDGVPQGALAETRP